jgi:hypothetical protein
MPGSRQVAQVTSLQYGWSILALHAHIVSSASVSATNLMALRRPSTPSVIR